MEEENNLVIRHYNKFKIHNREMLKTQNIAKLMEEWIYYVNLTGFQEKIYHKYYLGCKKIFFDHF